MQINETVKRVYETAKAKGWHDSPRSALEIHMLIVSEVAEATEEVRAAKPPIYVMSQGQPAAIEIVSPESFLMVDGDKVTPIKPEGEAIELADVVIRVMDYFGAKGWDLEAIIKAKLDYNDTRSYRHGGKAL